MKDDNDKKIIMIEIESIKIVNPRSRNKFIHDAIRDSIDNSGLRKPVTVRAIKDKKYSYALVCGQGRIEALIQMNEKYVPAIVKDISQEDGYIMSLVENIARRKPRATELYERIRDMKENGLSENEIANFTGCSESWVKSILLLMNRSEQKLLAAVESGKLPIYLAVIFSRSNSEENQNILIDAYEKGMVKPKYIAKIRNILDQRDEGNKGTPSHNYQLHKTNKKLSTEQLLQLYQDNVDEHKKLIAKNEYVTESLIITKKILTELLSDNEFTQLLKSESLNMIPSLILQQIKREEI
ncbi:ParB/RepB/Spo0J family partition protein [Mixta calida]|uniref:ParB/RepB/Spo0J family partition protein n=1 Tax=Mixta calida TaxID=665913 RepID=UPI0011A67CD8|nr:ParB/RepB/Spo0J family partition protein [Mixta calida]